MQWNVASKSIFYKNSKFWLNFQKLIIHDGRCGLKRYLSAFLYEYLVDSWWGKLIPLESIVFTHLNGRKTVLPKTKSHDAVRKFTLQITSNRWTRSFIADEQETFRMTIGGVQWMCEWIATETAVWCVNFYERTEMLP